MQRRPASGGTPTGPLLQLVLLCSLTLPSKSEKKSAKGATATLEAGWEMAQSGRLSEGVQAFEAVLEDQPGNTEALGYLAAVLPELGRNHEAETLLSAMLTSAPESPAARLFRNLPGGVIIPNGGTGERLRAWQRAHRAFVSAVTIPAAGPRIYHGVHELLLRSAIPSLEQLPSTSAPLHRFGGTTLRVPSDSEGIELYEGLLSENECSRIIALFERSNDEHFAGNIIQDELVAEDPRKQRTVQLDVKASSSVDWEAVDDILAVALVQAVGKYEMSHLEVSFLPNPLWDEGFRVKRYDPPIMSSDKTEDETGRLHHWHVDSDGNACRELAVLIYLSDVPVGGEMLFQTPQKRAISPKRGAVLIFPAAHTHSIVYARAPPLARHREYAASTFVASCNGSVTG